MAISTATEIGASGLTAQRRRLELLVSNLVNANTTAPPKEAPYRRKDVIMSAVAPEASFGQAFDSAMGSARRVEITQVVEDTKPPVRRYEPGHPHADADGIVNYPAINPVQEMVQVLTATRSYEANLQAVQAAREMVQKTLEIIR